MLAIVATAEGPVLHRAPRGRRRRRPAPNEALVAVRAFAVNRGELTLVARAATAGSRARTSRARSSSRRPTAPGPQVGERVAGLAEWHGWAEQAAVPTHRLAVVPDEVDFAAPRRCPMAGTTAANLVRGGGPLLGARVLITGRVRRRRATSRCSSPRSAAPT